MANLRHGPKIRELSSKETIATLESWKNTVIYGLRLNTDFRPYLQDGVVFGKKSKNKPYRDLKDDQRVDIIKEEGQPDREVVVIIKSREEKTIEVDLLLDQIANYAPSIPRNDITKDCKSLREVWIQIRQYYNKQPTGSLLNDVWNIKREFEETPQALFARMKQLYDDNLLTQHGLTHVDGQLTDDEELSPTLHSTIVLHWLQVLHPDLRNLVTQRFVTQLRDSTYAAIFPEISRSIDSLLEELSSGATACRSYPYNKPTSSQFQNRQSKPAFNNNHSSTYHKKKVCEFCKLTHKRYFYTHSTDNCLFIKKINESNTASVKQVEPELEGIEEMHLHYQEFYDSTEEESAYQIEHVLNRVNVDASPILVMEMDAIRCGATLDTGATCNIISEKKAKELKAEIRPTSQRVRMADGKSNLEVVGETDITLFRDRKPFHLFAIVCRHTDTEILAGMPFLKQNDIAIRPYSDEIIIDNKVHVRYDPQRKTSGTIRRLTIHADKYHVLLPGESEKYPVNGVSGEVAVEPRWNTYHNKKSVKEERFWPMPQVAQIIEGHISLSNTTQEPIILKKMEHIFNIHPEIELPRLIPEDIPNKSLLAQSLRKPCKSTNFTQDVKLNPDKLLGKEDESSFQRMLTMYNKVFDPLVGRYNGKSGNCQVEVNMGVNLPVQRKGRVPFYGKGDLTELQDKFDHLVEQGIMSRPQDIGVSVENINPSFLVKKQPPSTEKRLVTDFSSISQYCRPTPSLMPNVDSTLQSIASWKFLIKTDMSSAYHQIPMKRESKKYCGVHTPYRGLLVYNVGCMGLPGVEVALEELTCLLLGDMVKKGHVAKLADDLFIGGNTVQELRENFKMVLQKLLENNVRLNAAKTIIAPESVNILGWIWSTGSIRAGPHRLSALSTCQRPETVSALKSYLGAYRFLSRVIKSYAKWLAPLEEEIKGKDSKEKILWSDTLTAAFESSQRALQDAKTITIPRPSDRLCISTDASVKPGAVGATLYAVRDGKQLLAGFYNCKLPEFQTRWLPCEVEGLAIATALNHFSPVIIQSHQKPQVITDSKPCVEAVQKLRRGQFSASARLSSFLSSVSRYQAEIVHISGAANLPADFESRHPTHCDQPQCAICKFVAEVMDSVVQQVSVEEVLDGRAKLPYVNRGTWKAVQEECPDLRKVKTFKSHGTMPNRKSKNLRQVRRYLSAGILLTPDGVLVHPVSSPLGPVVERIVIPQQVLHGFLTVLHLKLNHPTAHQLSKAFIRYFYTLNLDKSISDITKSCHMCASLKEVPKAMIEETTEPPPSVIGSCFAADIIKKSSQKILIIRETVTSYTAAELINDETVKSISQSLVRMTNILHPSPTGNINIRLDPAPAHQSIFKSLTKESSLLKANIGIEIGRVLNKNKNPVIDKAIKELHRELLILYPAGGHISPLQLSRGIANLNSRYRGSGMSAHEMWVQRDQITGAQLPIKDWQLIVNQHKQREKNHMPSQRSKAPGKVYHPSPEVDVGSLVYVYNDRSKISARQRYIVTNMDGKWITLRKFTNNLFSNKEYQAKLQEIYKVPSFDDVCLPALVLNESSEDEEHYGGTDRDSTSASNISPKVHLNSSHEEESTASLRDDDDTWVPGASDEDGSEGSGGPVVTPPRNLTMDRQKRARKKPERYGTWN